jgi:N-acetyl-anhydromuramyl-L-alanine amidase AmpD
MNTVVAPSPRFIAARWHGGSQTPRAIVMHGTVSPCTPGDAAAVARFFATEDNKTSAHYIVDPSTAVQCVGDHTVAYHCGWNQDSIGVELCDPQTGSPARWEDAAHNAMLARAAKLVAQLCLVYDIRAIRPSIESLKAEGVHGIYGHNDSRLAFGNTTHVDPGSDFPWPTFLHAVKEEITTMSKNRVERAHDAENEALKLLQDALSVGHRGTAVRAHYEAIQKAIAAHPLPAK